MTKQFFIIRHCQAEGQESDAPLTKAGHHTALELVKQFKGETIHQVISSPFLRARQSIEPLVKEKNLHLQIDHRLSERILSGIPRVDWLDRLKDSFSDMDLKLEGGESSKEAQARIVEVVKEVVYSDAENTIMVTHGNIMSLLLKHFDHTFGFEQWQSLSNPDIFLLQLIDGEYFLKRIWQTESIKKE